MKFNSIKFKITTLYTAILGLILIVYSSILYFSLRSTLYQDLDSKLRAKAEQISKMLNSYLDTMGNNQSSFVFAAKRAIALETQYSQGEKIKELEGEWLPKIDKLGRRGDHINVLNSQGELIASSGRLAEKLCLVLLKSSAWDKLEVFRDIKFKTCRLRSITLPITYRGEKSYIIQIATPTKPIISVLDERMRTIVISIPIILVVTGFMGWLLVKRILGPVEEVTKIAKRITHEDLSVRVKTRRRIEREMRSLVGAFNDMISRLEKSFRYIGEFSSNVAHELKTPLAIIRGELEVALRKKRDTEEYQRVIRVGLEETARMIKIIDDLLLLAKLDYQPQVFKFESFDLIPFFTEIYEQSKILAGQKDIMVSIDLPDESINIEADRLHLRRLFFNLIHNAIKFNSPKGEIDITVSPENGDIRVSIRDTGIGISEENLPKVFDKFFHIDNRPNQESEPSSGLGLAIVQSIAKIHKGRIEVKSQTGEGSTFTVILPLS